VLPVICLSYGGLAFLAKLSRSSLLENLPRTTPAPRVPRAWTRKPCCGARVPQQPAAADHGVGHAAAVSLLAGSVIVESIFSIEGMGKLAVEAVQTRDRELVLSVTLISGLLTLAGYLLADLAYAIADPRVSYD
jgi:peptide/nickel transport system permease protein